MVGNEWLLLLPAGSAVLYVVAAFALKRAIGGGAGQAQVNLFANVFAGLLFLPLAAFAAEVDWTLAWMPMVAGGTFFLGQIFTFQALRHGDVTVATPLLGMKVLLIAVVSWGIFGEALAAKWWAGAAASSLGVVLVTGATLRTLAPRLLRSDALMSLAAAGSFALTDVFVRQWAGRFGVAAFIPLMFGEVAVFSLILFLPRGGWQLFRPAKVTVIPLVGGSLALSVQALGMALALSLYGNATAVNIVYSARSVGSVIAAWLLVRHFSSDEADIEPGELRRRFVGSILLFAAVVLVLI